MPKRYLSMVVVTMVSAIATSIVLVATVLGDAGDDPEPGTVFITEGADPYDSGRSSGLFSAIWWDPNRSKDVEGPTSVPLSDAIRWGRRRSEFVQVQFDQDETVYSAGSRAARGSTPLPDVVPAARPIGTPVDGSVQLVEYEIDVQFQVPNDGPRWAVRVDRRLRQFDEFIRLQVTPSGVTKITIIASVSVGGLLPAVAAARRLEREVVRLVGRKAVSDYYVDFRYPGGE